MSKELAVKICAVCAAGILLCRADPCVGDENKKEITRLLAGTYLAGGRHGDAIKAYREVLEHDPSDVEARIALADLLSWAGEYDASVNEYEKALELDPGNTEILKKLALVHYWKGDLESSEIIYMDILKISPGEKEVYGKLGEILIWRGEYARAMDLLSRAMEAGAERTERILYGRALLYSGRHGEAADIFSDILEEDPENIEAGIYLADALAYGKDFGGAIALYRSILGKGDDLGVKEKLADVLSWDRQYARSLALYDEILAERYDPAVNRQKARVLGWARRYGEAETEYGKILEREYSEIVELEMRAKKSYWSGRVRSAIAGYRELIERDPENLEAMFDLSQIYSYQGMWDDAVSLYDHILNIDPGHFRAGEGKEKAVLISRRVSTEVSYLFFEADSPGRETDVRKHRFISSTVVPLDPRTSLDITYALGGRMFEDFHDVLENEGRVKVSRKEGPDWHISGYYGLVSYNRDMDELFHLFGGDLGLRIMDIGTFTFFYDRERLKNNSTVIREYFHRHAFRSRVDLDLTRRLKAGADHLFARYSDGNFLNEPGSDVMYYISLEPRRLALKYRYFYREFAHNAVEYFSPKGFSTNVFSVTWRHFLNKEEIFFGADDIYYDLEYSLSLDSTGIAGHKFGWLFHWDIDKKLGLNLGGSIMGSSAGIYEESELTAGVKYYF